MKTFDSLDTWYNEFIVINNISHPETFPFLVIGNKKDIGKR